MSSFLGWISRPIRPLTAHRVAAPGLRPPDKPYMIIVDRKLAQRDAEIRPIQVAVIGAGEMAKGIINQLHRYTPGMRVALIYNRTLQSALDACRVAGIEDYRIVDTVAQVHAAIRERVPAITQRLELAFETGPLDVLIEATGTLEFGARTVLKAFEFGKHILSFNTELDATIGSLVAHRARQAGVKYSVAEGDQPGCTLNLYREVKMRGFNPLVAINIKGMLDQYRTPETQAGFAKSWGMNPYMATNFADGTKVNLEQAAIANCIGFRVNKRGMNHFDAPGQHVDALTQLYDLEDLQANGGIVDYIVGALPSPGVCIYATCSDPFTAKYLKYGKLGEGPFYSFYIPYHLLFFEIGSSVARLVDFDDTIIAAVGGPRVEVAAIAKTALSAGDKLDGLGGFKAYGECENTPTLLAQDLLPIGLADGATVLRDIGKDQPIRFADVRFDDTYLVDLYREQRRLFPGG
jgi:predicted homoserine dehydrogenase-like protein